MNKNPIIRSILYTISALLLLTGCTKELTEEGSSRRDGKKRMNFAAPSIHEEQAETRAALPINTTVRVVAFLAGGTTYADEQTYYMDSEGKLKPCTVNSDGSFKAIDTENELALLPDKYDFYAITPALPLNADQKTVTVPNGVDYASSVTSNITVNSDQTLTLTQLSRKSAKIALVVKKADDNAAMTSLAVSGSGVTISALPASQSIGLNKDITPAEGTTTLNISSSAFTLAGTTSTAITYLLPRLGTKRMQVDYNLTYTVSGASETKSVSGTMGNIVLEKGKSYTFTLTMRKTGASLSVTDWIESSQEVVTGQSLDYTDNGKPWFLIAANDSKNPTDVTKTTMNWYVATGTYDATYNPDAKKACPDGWRVPQKKELMLMWIYKDESSSYTILYNYWGSNESTSNNLSAWFVSLVSGVTTDNSKDNSVAFTARCIRDYSPTQVRRYPLVAEDGKTIVSRDEMGGAKENLLLTSVQKTWINATNTSTTPYNERSEYNKVSPVFRVAAVDISSLKNWKDAYSACKNEYSESDSPVGSWRLPTQRELMLMYVLNDKLSVPLATSGSNSYWAGLENYLDNSYASYLTFSNGTSGVYILKTKEHFVRCVRDAGLSVASSTVTADYAQWGNSFSKSVTFKSMSGSVSVKSIDNSGTDKNWLVSAVVSGSTSGQVTITYKPTPGNAGVHHDVTITLVNQGGITQDITVKYDNGFIPSSVLSENGWATNLPTDGVQIAKIGNKLPSGTADANWDSEFVQWANIAATTVPAAQEQGYGKGAVNTTAIITALGANGVAASKCRSLGADWYLPTLNELIAIRACQPYLGASYVLKKATSNDFYWSSSEQATGTISAWRLPMYTTAGGGSTNTKTESNYVRAVMNL